MTRYSREEIKNISNEPYEYGEKVIQGLFSQLLEEVRILREGLIDAKEMIIEWSGYASDYFKEKWNLEGDLKQIDEALTKADEVGKVEE